MSEHTQAAEIEYRVCWLDSDGNPTDQTAEGEPSSFPTLDHALEWDPQNCEEFLTWVEVRPVFAWSTDLRNPPGERGNGADQ